MDLPDASSIRLVHSAERPMGERNEAFAVDDVELVARAQAGVMAAQGQLFQVHAPRLLPMLVRLLASKSDAEDALQDAFIEAFRDLAQLKDLATFGGWLRQIAVHQAHRRFRKRRLLGFLGLDRAPLDSTLETIVHPDAAPDVKAELANLDRLLQKLPADERTAWVLRNVEGYELTEVAAMCDCSLATAKRWIGAAQARISKRMALPEVARE